MRAIIVNKMRCFNSVALEKADKLKLAANCSAAEGIVRLRTGPAADYIEFRGKGRLPRRLYGVAPSPFQRNGAKTSVRPARALLGGRLAALDALSRLTFLVHVNRLHEGGFYRSTR